MYQIRAWIEYQKTWANFYYTSYTSTNQFQQASMVWNYFEPDYSNEFNKPPTYDLAKQYFYQTPWIVVDKNQLDLYY